MTIEAPYVNFNFVVNSWSTAIPGFRYLYSNRDDSTHYESFIYQSLDGEIKHAEDCIGCYQEVGDTSVLHAFRSAQESEDQFNRALEVGDDAKYRQEVPERSVLKNPDGQVMGKRSLAILYEDGKVLRARFIWVENGEYWDITSFDEKHVRAFEPLPALSYDQIFDAELRCTVPPRQTTMDEQLMKEIKWTDEALAYTKSFYQIGTTTTTPIGELTQPLIRPVLIVNTSPCHTSPYDILSIETLRCRRGLGGV